MTNPLTQTAATTKTLTYQPSAGFGTYQPARLEIDISRVPVGSLLQTIKEEQAKERARMRAVAARAQRAQDLAAADDALEHIRRLLSEAQDLVESLIDRLEDLGCTDADDPLAVISASIFAAHTTAEAFTMAEMADDQDEVEGDAAHGA
jgi:hypothetical protein